MKYFLFCTDINVKAQINGNKKLRNILYNRYMYDKVILKIDEIYI